MSEGINWSQIAGVALAAVLTGGGASLGVNRFQEDGHSQEVQELQREIDTLKQLQREESRERSRMIRELRRDIMTELRLAGYSVDTSMVEYYSLEPAADAMEALDEAAEDLEPVEPE